jgi:hypothetical protein
METTTLVLIAVLVVGLLLGRKFISPRQPKEKNFRCTRCKATSEHTHRTINAWRAGKTTFFCNSCHARWLESKPRDSESGSGPVVRGSRSGSGCLSVLAVVAIVPLAVVAYVLFV